MAIQFRIKVNTTIPSLTAQLFDETGAGQDLATGVDSVAFIFEPLDENEAATSRACVITDSANGKVRVDWNTLDTDSVGEFNGEFAVAFSNGTVKTFPSSGFFSFAVTEDVAT